MASLPIIVYDAQSAHESVRELSDKEFLTIAVPHRTTYMEIFNDRVFLYPVKIAKALQRTFLLLVNVVLIALAVFEIVKWQDFLLFQLAIFIAYFLFVATKASYDRVLVPVNYTNYYRNQLRDDPESKVQTLTYDAVVVDWSGYHQIPQPKQVIRLSNKVGSKIQKHLKSELEPHLSSRPNSNGLPDDAAFLEEQKKQSDPYNLTSVNEPNHQ